MTTHNFVKLKDLQSTSPPVTVCQACAEKAIMKMALPEFLGSDFTLKEIPTLKCATCGAASTTKT